MKRLTVITVTLLLALSIQAEPVTKDQARNVAISWYKHIVSAPVGDYTIDADYTTRHDDLVTFYTFVFHSGGFVIVAADDASIPILGYSDKNSFPEEISCPAAREWLESYSNQINHIVESGMSNSETMKEWEAIIQGNLPALTKDVEPLLTTTWDQGCYYNELCPADPAGLCGHTLTGCVATAMAQVMKYHNFPPQGVGSYSYPHPVYGTQSVDFSSTIYDWASMSDYVNESNIPVATIMYHAGVSVDMIYGVEEGSGTSMELVPGALVEYFNYHPEIQLIYQNDFTDPDAWKDLLRDNLDEQLPILYAGYLPDYVGHAFVCDGYQISDEKFHFNWGWSGSWDAWYTIGALNPGNSLNLGNLAILHIKPYNSVLITRITEPLNNAIIKAGNSVTIHAETVFGIPDQMKITIGDNLVASGNTGSLSYTWNTTTDDVGSYDVRVWALANNDSVFHQVNLNITNEWIEQASRFQTPMRAISWVHAVDSNIVWAIARDGINEWGAGVQEFAKTLNGGVSWSAGVIAGCEGLGCAMVYAMNEMKAYIPMYRISGTNPRGIYVTLDGGVTWSRQESAPFSHNYSFPDCIHFFNENDGWCLGDPIPQEGAIEFEIYTTSNGGGNWIPVSAGNKPNSLTGEYAMPHYSSINDTIWFGTTKGRIYKSTDRGNNWTVFTVPDMLDKWITPVFRNGSHGLVHNFFYVGNLMIMHDGAICETFDGGETWTTIATTGPLYWTDLAYIPGTENTWVSTGGRKEVQGRGASFSKDGGHTWVSFPGTEGANFRNMSWINNHCGWAGSFNLNDSIGGIYKFVGALPTSPSGIDPNFSSLHPLTIRVFPNPGSRQITIEYNLQEPGMASLTIFNHLGQEVGVLVNELQTKGIHKLQWNTEGLPSGIYFCVLKTKEGLQTKKIIKPLK